MRVVVADGSRPSCRFRRVPPATAILGTTHVARRAAVSAVVRGRFLIFVAIQGPTASAAAAIRMATAIGLLSMMAKLPSPSAEVLTSLLRQRAEYQSEHERGDRQVEFLENPPDHAEYQHQPHAEHVLGDGVGPNDTGDDDDRVHVVVRIRSIWANTGAKGRFSTSSSTLPMKNDTSRPQINAGWFSNSNGPAINGERTRSSAPTG
jgi:hypothetical protein